MAAMMETDKTRVIQDFFHVISSRIIPITIVFIVVVGLVSFMTFTAKKRYSAECLILVEQSSSRVLSLEGALQFGMSTQEYYLTQYKILESRTLAEEVAKKLKLYRYKEFGAPEYLAQDNKPLPVNYKPEPGAISSAARVVQGNLQVIPVRNSRLIILKYTSNTPELATSIVNSLATAYEQYTFERKLNISRAAGKFLKSRIEEQKQKLQASQLALQKYIEDQGLAAAMSSNYESIIAQKLADLKAKLIEAETNRKEAEAHFRLAQSAITQHGSGGGLTELITNPIYQDVRTKELDAQKQQAELSQRYGPNHPKILALKSTIANLVAARQAEANKVLNSIKQTYKVALARENALKAAYEKEKTDAVTIRKKAMGFIVLNREVDTNNQLYDMLLSKSKEAGVTADIDVGTVTVVDRAEVPKAPSFPNVKLNLILGVGVGLFLALAFGFWLEFMDNTIKFPEQVSAKTGLPCLGTLPFEKNAEKNSILDFNSVDSQNPTKESLRAIRTAISLSRAGGEPRVLLVTSSLAAEGKSIISSQLAATFAMNGERTLLLECDMRKPRQHRLFNQNRELGLSSCLGGAVRYDQIFYKELLPNLDVVFTGPTPPNPYELLNSSLMGQLVEYFRKTYDRVIIDTPPLLPIADTTSLAHLADGVLMVVAAGVTRVQAVQASLNKLKGIGTSPLGIILNQSKRNTFQGYYRSYHYNYYYTYGYGYGQNVDSKKAHKKHAA